MRLFSTVILLLLYCCPFTTNGQQPSFRERDLQEMFRRDSAYVDPSFFVGGRYFLNGKNLSYKDFERALMDSDKEVAVEIAKGRNRIKVGRYVAVGSFALIVGGMAGVGKNNSNSGGWNTPAILVLTGLVGEGVAIGFGANGRSVFRRGVGLYNIKVRSGKLEPYQVSVGITNNGLGLSLPL